MFLEKLKKVLAADLATYEVTGHDSEELFPGARAFLLRAGSLKRGIPRQSLEHLSLSLGLLLQEKIWRRYLFLIRKSDRSGPRSLAPCLFS